MPTPLHSYFKEAQEHRQQHQCGSVPYEHGNLLITMILATKAKTVLEIGTGIGYSAACMAYVNSQVQIHTIDKDHDHLILAKNYWKQLHVTQQITPHEGKAHNVIKDFTQQYNIVFFDGYTPQRKFLPDFGRLLKKGGILITANLFLNNTTGGKYLKELENKKKWQTCIVDGTALSVKAS